jgi:hypothetical protein
MAQITVVPGLKRRTIDMDEPLDFHAPTKVLLNLQVLVIEGLKIGFRRRRLVGVPKFEKMRVASWHIRTQPRHISSTSWRVCPYSH